MAPKSDPLNTEASKRSNEQLLRFLSSIPGALSAFADSDVVNKAVVQPAQATARAISIAPRAFLNIGDQPAQTPAVSPRPAPTDAVSLSPLAGAEGAGTAVSPGITNMLLQGAGLPGILPAAQPQMQQPAREQPAQAQTRPQAGPITTPRQAPGPVSDQPVTGPPLPSATEEGGLSNAAKLALGIGGVGLLAAVIRNQVKAGRTRETRERFGRGLSTLGAGITQAGQLKQQANLQEAKISAQTEQTALAQRAQQSTEDFREASLFLKGLELDEKAQVRQADLLTRSPSEVNTALNVAKEGVFLPEFLTQETYNEVHSRAVADRLSGRNARNLKLAADILSARADASISGLIIDSEEFEEFKLFLETSISSLADEVGLDPTTQEALRTLANTEPGRGILVAGGEATKQFLEALGADMSSDAVKQAIEKSNVTRDSIIRAGTDGE